MPEKNEQETVIAMDAIIQACQDVHVDLVAFEKGIQQVLNAEQSNSKDYIIILAFLKKQLLQMQFIITRADNVKAQFQERTEPCNGRLPN